MKAERTMMMKLMSRMMKLMMIWMVLMTEWNRMMRSINGNGRWNGKWQWLNVAYQNLPAGLSTTNKEDNIEQILSSHKPHILGLAEPRATELETMYFEGYSLVRGNAVGINNPRLNVLIKDGLTVEFEPFDTEIPSLLIKIGQVRVLMLYREWSYDGDEDTCSFPQQEARWSLFVDKWKKLRGRVNVVGDCNFEFWRMETNHHRNCQNLKNEVLEKIIPRGYVQCIQDNTRHQGMQKACLDHLYTNNAQFIDTILNKSVTSYDHNLIMFKMMLNRPAFQPHKIHVRNVKKISPVDFQKKFSELDHSDFLMEPDVDKKVGILVKNVVAVLDEISPVRTIKIKQNHAKYLTPELMKEIKDRDELRAQAVRTGSEEDWRRFKIFRNLLRKKLKVQKKNYLSQKILTSDSKEMWKVLKESSGLQTKRTSQIQLRIGDQLVKDPKVVAEELSKYYVDKVEKIVEEHPPDPELSQVYTRRYLRGRQIDHFDFQHVTVNEVIKIVADLKSTGATGEDGIPVTLLKKLIYSLAFFITVIVNDCISQCKYPDSFKYGLISPVPKPGDPTEKKSWRPVTILDAMSKVVEKVLNKQLRDHLLSNGLISHEQHAYQENRSVMTAWSEIDSITVAGLDRRRLVGYQLQDMSAAFNVVDEAIVVPKLKMMGCSDYVCKLIRNYLTGRRNSVKIRSHVSPPVPVSTGVGEGSVLGPLLFLICILEVTIVMEIVRERLLVEKPEMVQDIELHTVQFADDCTNVFVTDTEDQMEAAMEVSSAEYHRYFSAQGMKLNLEKEEHIVHAHSALKRTKEGGVRVDGRPEASKVKLLGMTVESNYKFSAHTSKLISQANQRLAHVAKVKDLVPAKQLRIMMDSLVFSILDWGLELVGRDLTNLKRLQLVQNVAMRVLTNAGMEMSIRVMIQRLKMLNMLNRTRLKRMSLMRRIIKHQSCPETLRYVVMPRDGARIQQMRTTYPNNLVRQSGKSLLVNGLQLLNDCNWLRDHQDASDMNFKKLAKKFIVESYDNGKLS